MSNASDSPKDPTKRFTGLADSYARFRPAYPAKLFEALAEKAPPVPGCIVADIGCGTGISSRQLAERGWQVIGVEPNEEMLRKAKQVPCESVQYHLGRAEETGLSQESMRLVVCAQAFHWFDANRSLAEFHRILLDEGWVGLIWNERDTRDQGTEAYSRIITSHPEAAIQEERRQQAGKYLLNSPYFEKLEIHRFGNDQWMDRSQMIGRAFSASYAPVDPDGRGRWEEGLGEVFDRYAENGSFRLVYQTSLYLGCKAGRAGH